MGKLGFDPLQLVDYVVDDVSRLQMFGQDIPCIDFDLDLGRQACLLLPEENANPECGQPTIFQISHHWGIARPNCPAMLAPERQGLGNDNRTNEGHSRLCSRRRGKELYRGGGTHRSVEVGSGQKRRAARGSAWRTLVAAHDP